MNHKFKLTHMKGARRIGTVTGNNRETLQTIADTMNKRKPELSYKVEPNTEYKQNETVKAQ